MQLKQTKKECSSFLYCPKKDNLCFGREFSGEGIECKYENCLLEDPEYIEQQKKIEIKRKENARREIEERKRQEETPPPAKKTDLVKELAGYIARREAMARRAYRENKPRKGDAIMHEVLILTGKLRKMKGA